eukprot:gene15608-32968_t
MLDLAKAIQENCSLNLLDVRYNTFSDETLLKLAEALKANPRTHLVKLIGVDLSKHLDLLEIPADAVPAKPVVAAVVAGTTAAAGTTASAGTSTGSKERDKKVDNKEILAIIRKRASRQATTATR